MKAKIEAEEEEEEEEEQQITEVYAKSQRVKRQKIEEKSKHEIVD